MPLTEHSRSSRGAWARALAAGLLSFAGLAAGAEPVSFNDSIQPILLGHCAKCHGGVKQAGGVSFVYEEQALGRGKSGLRVIVPGNAEESELYRRVTTNDPDDRMPPMDGSPHGLSNEEQRLIREWIGQGAQWGKHWSFEAPRKQSPPSVAKASWAREALDRFILARMESHGLRPSKEAAPEAWLRRVSLDLTGLPPNPGDLELFEKQRRESSERAYGLAVDRLLAAPAFGERWASVWMDQVRYADSRGLGADGRRTIWKYRDWLIDAFNADLPFDQFTIKQLAGDLLPDATMEDLIATACQRNTQSNNEGGTDDEQFRVDAVIDRVNTTWQVWQATTFGCAQCHSHPYEAFRHEDYYRFMAYFNNTTDSDTGNDDPILDVPLNNADYAAARALDVEIDRLSENIWKPADALRRDASIWKPLNGLKASTKYGTTADVERVDGVDEFLLPEAVKQKTSIILEAPLPAGLSRITALKITAKPRDPARALADSEWGFIVTRLKAEVEGPNGGASKVIPLTHAVSDEPRPHYDPVESLKGGNFGFAAYTRINHTREAVFVPSEAFPIEAGSTLRVSLDHSVFLLASFTMVIRRGSVAVSDDQRWTEFAIDPKFEKWRAELAGAEKKRGAIPTTKAPVMRERADWLRRPTHVFTRGDYLEKAERVEAGIPTSMQGGEAANPANRLELARWLVGPENPLTARVAVNRFWEQMFGVGIVPTLEDFGSSGEKPTHPELLDFLALRFQNEHGWGMKGLLREFALSATYRQDAAASAEARAADPSNRWLSRGTRRRLSAEMVRDQALSAAGLLSPKMYGEPVRPPIPDGVWKPFAQDPWETAKGEDRFRRSVYTYVKRSIPYPSFAAFDAPSREFCSPRRLSLNTPLQALVTLNDEAFAECASGLARRMDDAGESLSARLAYGYRWVACREIDGARSGELENLYRAALKSFQGAGGSGEMPEKTAKLSALNIVAGVLLNLDEVLTR